MNLLLILSALLSALTGAISGVREPVRYQAVQASAVQASVVRIARPVAAVVVEAALPSLADSAPLGVTSIFELTPAAPLYTSRRRE